MRRFEFNKRSQLFVRPLESTVDRNRAGSRFLFLAEFLESGIATQRVPFWIEP
jgi:hypothetical protein